MKHYLVYGYDEWGDYEFYVYTEDKDHIPYLIRGYDCNIKIRAVYGPFEPQENDVVLIKGPE